MVTARAGRRLGLHRRGAGTASQPVSGNFSTGFNPTVTAGGAAALELDFSSGTSPYTATDDLAGPLSLNQIQLNLAQGGSGGVTINNAGGGQSLNFVLNGATNPVIFQNNTGAVTFNLPISVTASGPTLTFGGNSQGTGAVGVAGAISGAGGLAFSGAETVTLSGANALTGPTAVTSGGLVLDYTSDNTVNKIGTGVLTLGGGLLTLNGNAGAASSQTVASTTVGGGSFVVVNPGAGQTATLNLGAITRTANAGSVDFSGAGTISTATANNATGILGGYATFGGADWATVSGGNIGAYTGYTPFTATGTVATVNYSQSGAGTVTASETVNSLKITDTAATQSLVLSTGVTLTVGPAASGGLLYAGGTSNAYTISGGTAVGAGAGNELLLNVKTGGTLTVSTPILTATNAGVTKAGGGTLVLGGTNTYTGTTAITAGTLQVAADANLGGATAPISLNGGTLKTTAAVTDTHVLTVGASGGNFVLAGQYFFGTANTLAGSGPLLVTGNNLRSNVAQTYSGVMTLNSGGSYEANGGALAAGASFIVKGTGDGVVGTSGELISTSGVTVANAVTVNGGILSFDNGTAGLFSGAITLGPGGAQVATRDWYQAVTGRGGTLSGLVSGTGALTKSNFAGTVTLTGANNTYSGGTTVLGGTLSANAVGTLGTGNVTLNSGGVLTQSVANALNGGAGQALVVTNGTANLSFGNTYGGGTTLTAGSLVLGNGATGSATGSGNVTLNGGSLTTTAAGATVAGTVLAGSGAHTIAPGGVGPVATLTLGGLTTNSNTTLNFDLTGPWTSTPGNTGDLVNAGALTAGAGTKLAFNFTPNASGNYRLLGYNAGTSTGLSQSNFVLPANTARTTYTLDFGTVDPGFADLVVTNIGGTINGSWIGTGAGATRGAPPRTGRAAWSRASPATPPTSVPRPARPTRT